MKKLTIKISAIIGGIFLALVVSCFLIYKVETGRVSSNDSLKEIIIENGQNYYSISNDLKENNLIKSEWFYKLYVKLHKPASLQAGKYYLSESMGVKDIVDKLSKGSNYNPDAIRITFKEGINMRGIAKIISENTNNTIDVVYDTLKDTTYLDSIIEKYWFLTDEIKNKNIYYSLEGYLFPDTYEFINKDVTVKEIFNVMLVEMNKKLEPYKEEIEKSKYSAHQLLTLASIVELESASSVDRPKVAGVFYNRLNNHDSLGSDVTTYYAAKIDLNERDLYQSEINDYNAYNTRNANMAGRLPVGPICIPSLSSIVAAIEPEQTDYYFFVADKYKKTYFSKTYAEHLGIIARLQAEGLWYTY